MNVGLLDGVILGDCVAGMQDMPADSADLVIADPPYNLSKGGRWRWNSSDGLPGMGGDWNKHMASWDSMPFGEYAKFTTTWITEMRRVLKDTGSFWIFGTYHNIGLVNVILQMMGVEMLNEIIWYKRNAFPNLSGRRFTASHENILWGHVGKERKYRFNYQATKDAEFPYDHLKKAGKQMRTVWDIPNNKHPEETIHGKVASQKPLAVSERIIASTTTPGQMVLVPFCGSGTECVAAIRAGRKFVAFENNPTHHQIATRRIRAELSPGSSTPNTRSCR